MAILQIGSVHGINANAGKNINGGDDGPTGYVDPNMLSINALRARLIAIAPTSYTASRLNSMTMNDMVYAVRVHDNLAGVN